MKISRNNYELFFIDYLDNNLDQQQLTELAAFLMQNSDLEAELYEMKSSGLKLVESSVAFKNKNSLKKTSENLLINKDNFNDLCIAKIENDLDASDEKLFNRYLELNNDKLETFRQFEKTKLIPDTAVNCDFKNSLKRHSIYSTRRKSLYYRITSVAAVILILVIAVRFNQNNLQKSPQYKQIQNAQLFNYIPEINTQNVFSVVNTETPELLSKSINQDNHTTNNFSDLQYVDHTKAVFISDFIKKLRSTEQSDNELFISKNAFKNTSNPQSSSNQINYAFSENKNLASSELPAEIILLNGEIRNNEIITDLLNQMYEKLPEANRSETPESTLTFWDIADAGFKGYSILTGKKVNFIKEFDEKGKVKSLAINSGRFEFSRK